MSRIQVVWVVGTSFCLFVQIAFGMGQRLPGLEDLPGWKLFRCYQVTWCSQCQWQRPIHFLVWIRRTSLAWKNTCKITSLIFWRNWKTLKPNQSKVTSFSEAKFTIHINSVSLPVLLYSRDITCILCNFPSFFHTFCTYINSSNCNYNYIGQVSTEPCFLSLFFILWDGFGPWGFKLQIGVMVCWCPINVAQLCVERGWYPIGVRQWRV